VAKCPLAGVAVDDQWGEAVKAVVELNAGLQVSARTECMT